MIDFVCVGGLRQIIEGAELHSGDGGGDVAVAGEDDAARVRAGFLQFLDDVESIAVAQPHVDDREGRRRILQRREALGHRLALR